MSMYKIFQDTQRELNKHKGKKIDCTSRGVGCDTIGTLQEVKGALIKVKKEDSNQIEYANLFTVQRITIGEDEDDET